MFRKRKPKEPPGKAAHAIEIVPDYSGQDSIRVELIHRSEADAVPDDHPIVTALVLALQTYTHLAEPLGSNTVYFPASDGSSSEIGRQTVAENLNGERGADASIFLAHAFLRFNEHRASRLYIEGTWSDDFSSMFSRAEDQLKRVFPLSPDDCDRLAQCEAPFLTLAGDSDPKIPAVEGYPTPFIPILAVQVHGVDPNDTSQLSRLEGSRRASQMHFTCEALKHAIHLTIGTEAFQRIQAHLVDSSTLSVPFGYSHLYVLEKWLGQQSGSFVNSTTGEVLEGDDGGLVGWAQHLAAAPTIRNRGIDTREYDSSGPDGSEPAEGSTPSLGSAGDHNPPIPGDPSNDAMSADPDLLEWPDEEQGRNHARLLAQMSDDELLRLWALARDEIDATADGVYVGLSQAETDTDLLSRGWVQRSRVSTDDGAMIVVRLTATGKEAARLLTALGDIPDYAESVTDRISELSRRDDLPFADDDIPF